MSLRDVITQIQAADAALELLGPAPFHVSIRGIEAVVAGAVSGLERGDWWCPGLRERCGAVARGVPVDRLVDGFRGARPYKVAPPTENPALRCLVGVGLAAGSGRPCLIHLGVGSAADGAFAEALNLAAIRQVPAIFLVALHPLDRGAPVGPQLAADIERLAGAFGIQAWRADGSRADSVHEAVRSAASHARSTGAPAVIVAPLIPGSDPLALA